MNRKFFVLIAIAVLGLTGCQKDDEYSGNGIRFSVSTGTEGTKTSYGDATGEVGSRTSQRIDWEIGDVVHIYSPQVSAPATLSQNYQVTSVSTATNGNSQGTIALADANAEPLQWNTDPVAHSFYAIYPSPEATGAASGFEMYNKGGAVPKVALSFPDEETLIDNVTETSDNSGNYVVTPDTKYLYMMAQTLGLTEEAAGTRQEVFLTFHPVSTAIEFTITNNFSSGGSMNVQEVFLKSSAPLWGITKSDFAEWAGSKPEFSEPETGVLDVQRANKTGIIVGSTDKPLTLAYGKTLTFTFFLPAGANITDLIFGITGTNNTTNEGFTRSTAISKNDGTPVIFEAFKKHFVRGILVPEGATWIVAGDVSVTPWNETSEDLNFDE